MGKVRKWAIAVALIGAACAKGNTTEPGNSIIGPVDAGPVVDAGPTVDAGPADAGPADAGPADGGGIKFGGPGPWPISNVQYSWQDGIQEMPVVGVSTDENQNLWLATNAALYLLRPGDKTFTRFDGHSGLHLPGFPIPKCDDSAGLLDPCPAGEAAPPGINEIVGGGAGEGYLGEVFVGYWAFHDWSLTDGTEQDPWRHSGKLDRVRLVTDKSGNPSLEVVRFDMVSNNTVKYWHNKSVMRMVYDHRIHPHELYVGCDHGVDKISPDKWKLPDKDASGNPTWFLLPQNQQSWMSDHLHPQACVHQHCDAPGPMTQMLADWRGLAIAPDGDLWVGGRYAAGKIVYVAENTEWWKTPRTANGPSVFQPSYGDGYDGNCSGNRPIFCPPLEGDPVNISAVTVAKDGKVWFASGTLFNESKDVPYGIASVENLYHITYYDPVRDVGLPEMDIRDLVALPDGRLVVAGLNSGLMFWDPATGKRTPMRAGQGIPNDRVLRLQLDTMVDPPALMVATAGGAAVLRILP